jgi:hypothetical protein
VSHSLYLVFSEPPAGVPPDVEHEAGIDDLRLALFDRIARGEAPLPAWFDDVRFTTWSCTPLEDRIEPAPYELRRDPAADRAVLAR